MFSLSLLLWLDYAQEEVLSYLGLASRCSVACLPSEDKVMLHMRMELCWELNTHIVKWEVFSKKLCVFFLSLSRGWLAKSKSAEKDRKKSIWRKGILFSCYISKVRLEERMEEEQNLGVTQRSAKTHGSWEMHAPGGWGSPPALGSLYSKHCSMVSVRMKELPVALASPVLAMPPSKCLGS